MLIIGAGGLAAQLFDDLVESRIADVVFWSESKTKYGFIQNYYRIIDTDEAVHDYFTKVSSDFILCVGNDKSMQTRKLLSAKFKALGGSIISYLSPYSRISPYDTEFGMGTVILNQVNVEPGVKMGEECLVNKTANIGHGCLIGAYSEIGPAAILTGEVELGSDCYVGTGAIILPKIKIGSGAVVAAGAVVTKDIPVNAVISGVPARVIYTK